VLRKNEAGEEFVKGWADGCAFKCTVSGIVNPFTLYIFEE
jgi:hypothetical protein